MAIEEMYRTGFETRRVELRVSLVISSVEDWTTKELKEGIHNT